MDFEQYHLANFLDSWVAVNMKDSHLYLLVHVD